MKKRLYNLDIIKILATFGILFHHYQQFFKLEFSGINFYGGSFSFGYLVELFFMISGFLVAYTDDGTSYIYSFLKKYLRFLPSVLLAGIVFLLIRVISLHTLGYDLDGRSYSVANIIASLFLFQSGWGIEFSFAVNNPVWYLCVLLLCYLIYYVVTFLTKKFSVISRTYVLLFLAMIAVLFNFFHVYIPFFHLANLRGYASFFIGVCLYDIYTSSDKIKNFKFLFITGIICYIICSIIKGISLWYSLVLFLFPAMLISALTIKQANYKALSFGGGYHLTCISGMAVFSELSDFATITTLFTFNTHIPPCYSSPCCAGD